MKNLTLLALLGASTVQGAARKPDDIGSVGSWCGTVFDSDNTKSENMADPKKWVTKTVKCDNHLVCAGLDTSGVSFNKFSLPYH